MEVKIGGSDYFSKRYIKDHPDYLFIFEDTLEDEEFEDYKNVLPIPTYDERGNYFRDKHLERNKIIIKDAIEDVLKEVKKKSFRRVVVPEKSIGKGKSKLYDNETETYEYIKRKMSELTTELKRSKYSSRDKYRSRDRYGKMMYKNRYDRSQYDRSQYGVDIFGRKDYRGRDRYMSRRRYENNSENNRRYSRKSRKGRYGSRRRTKKELRKLRKQKKTRKINIDTLPKASKYAQKRCNACIRLKSLLKRPLIDKKKKGDKFVKELEKAERKCLECHEICKFLDRNLKLGLEDFDIYKARYPSICLLDEKGSKRVFRLMNSYRKKLLEQIEHFDLNLEKE
jgi:hypothetical protein